MIAITDEMRELIDGTLVDRVPCFLGTTSKDGFPAISMKAV